MPKRVIFIYYLFQNSLLNRDLFQNVFYSTGIVFLMAGGGRRGKRRRSSAQQPTKPPVEDVGS